MEFRLILGWVILTSTIVDCSKILIIIGMPAQSHYNVFIPIIEQLASRKHDITVQAFHNLRHPLSNVKELKLSQDPFQENESTKQFFLNTLKLSAVGLVRSFAPFAPKMCQMYLTEETTKTLLNDGMQYDVVILDALFAECQRAVSSLIGKYIIDLYTSIPFPWYESAAPAPPSYVPVFTDYMKSKMNFFQRLKNTYNLLGVRFVQDYNLESLAQEVLSELLPQSGSIAENKKKVVFTITNADPVVLSPRPSMPNIIHCGGMHCRAAKPLPKEIDDFVESSGDDGFIIFGLGSNMKSEYLSPQQLKNIVSVFSRLKQKVIWKFEGTQENLPKNVKITKWLPQQDLLGHPKARLFITHSGLLSLQESIYHAVPVIGMPFFSDQRGNIMRMKELGIGELFNFLNLTEHGFYEVINSVINDKSYYENMKKYSRIFKDQPERPVDRAVFWIEYVIRHDGARHFRSAGEDLHFFQYFLLDVAGFVLLVLVAAVGFTAFLGKLLLKKLCARKEKKTINFEKKTK